MNKKILIQFLDYAQRQGAIYNSIKAFFRELGKENPETIKFFLQAQLGNPIGSFWYYAGHAIGSLIQNSKYEVFAKETIQQLSKSKDTLENKAVVDVLTELDPRKIDNKLLSWSLLQLENIVDLVNNRDKTNWHFKWSVTEAVEKVFTEFNSRLCFSILKKCVKGINGFEDNNRVMLLYRI